MQMPENKSFFSNFHEAALVHEESVVCCKPANATKAYKHVHMHVAQTLRHFTEKKWVLSFKKERKRREESNEQHPAIHSLEKKTNQKSTPQFAVGHESIALKHQVLGLLGDLQVFRIEVMITAFL